MAVVMNINIAVVVLNALLLSGLLWAYGGMLRELPTRFTWGLLGFATALWLQQAVQLYFYATMMEYFVPGVQPLVLAQNVLVTIAAGTLLSVTLRPSGFARQTGETDL